MILRSKSGFSLIESAVATTLFAFLVIALSTSLLGTRRAGALSATAAVASTLALDKLEQLRSLSTSAADLTEGSHVDPLNPIKADGTTRGIFTRSWVVTDDVPEPNMKRVEMRISWRDWTGTNVVSFVTLESP